jgi:hypothetical protein
VDKLAKDIEGHLKERAFCLVFEDELERCWPSEKIERAEREKQLQTFAKFRGSSASILNTDAVILGQYSGVEAEGPHPID